MIHNMRRKRLKYLLLCIVIAAFLNTYEVHSQTTQINNEIKVLIDSFKKDPRGPYKAIRWFCPDGSILPPDQSCPEKGGIQHAIHKDRVKVIAEQYKIYLGQILAGIPYGDFWDSSDQNSRLKQYQMKKYLHSVDDGWIFRRARYYRGAIQVEDEEEWSSKFSNWILTDAEFIKSQFFLLRQIIRDLPHPADNDKAQAIRSTSKMISDTLPAFMDLRVKLHGQPESSDLEKVKQFRQRNKQKITPAVDKMFQTLERDLEIYYKPVDVSSLNKLLNKIPANIPLYGRISTFIKSYGNLGAQGKETQTVLVKKSREAADILWDLRINIIAKQAAKSRTAMIQLSNLLESLLFKDVSNWKPDTIGDLLEKNYVLAKAVAGCGFLEIWEWEEIESLLRPGKNEENLSLEKFLEIADYARRCVEWSTGMVHAVYDPTVTLFAGFESLSLGFIDDRIRSMVLLHLGISAGELGKAASRFSGISNEVFEIPNQNQIRGLNPGFAFGELEVVSGSPEDISYSPNKIYVFIRPPADLKPVAGIATVSEGNLVSHVQLLARNLGIPNAVISQQNLNDLLPLSGKKIFYAVSQRGRVIMKTETRITPQEKELVEVKKRPEEEIMVPVDKIDLKQVKIINLRKLRSSDSGRLCGPKAANLGQLKSLFPQKVVEGFAIPFGIFKRHLDQQMPGTGSSYWYFLQETFKQAEKDRKTKINEPEIESKILKRLEKLREAIKTIPLLPDFVKDLNENFINVFGVEIGKIPVFVRSDTNMEDLKDFTGAGLNLTLFNVLDKNQIYNGIKEVWASPYSERSYRWRQKYLLNPENVFPSVLIIPTVDVDKSGVMITTGVSSSDIRDITIAFSLGAGGAVEGQAAESYLLNFEGKNLLISPSREIKYNVLPHSGGSDKGYTNLNKPILSREDLTQLRTVADEIKTKLPGTSGIEGSGPFDVELGFKDGKIWLFQVRPFVENKRAKSSVYLRNLDPELPKNKVINLKEKSL